MSETENARFRWATPTRKGRWLSTRREAFDAAVRAKVASRDPHSGQVYLDVLVSIERDDPA